VWRFRPIRTDLLDLPAIKGKRPLSVLWVTVEEAFFHCAKALIRVRLRDPEGQVERPRFPGYGRVPAVRIAGTDAAEIDAGEEQGARTELY